MNTNGNISSNIITTQATNETEQVSRLVSDQRHHEQVEAVQGRALQEHAALAQLRQDRKLARTYFVVVIASVCTIFYLVAI